MQISRLAIPDVVLIEPTMFGDARGFFQESWNKKRFHAAGMDMEFVQDNHSRSIRHTLRGLHYQLRKPQGKLVRVVRGEIFDIAADIRRQSPTFGRWVGTKLSEDNHHQLLIPAGFAHGFLVLSEIADVLYKTTDFFDPADQHCIRWNDPTIGVQWPLPAGVAPVLSAKDADGLSLDQSEVFQ